MSGGVDARTVVLNKDGTFARPWLNFITRQGAQASGKAGQVLHGSGTGGATVWAPVDLTADVTGNLPVSHGGTGLDGSTGAAGELLSFTGVGTIGPVPAAPLGNVLHANPTGLPSWGPIDLSADMFSNVLPVSRGGTGVASSIGTGVLVLASAFTGSGSTIALSQNPVMSNVNVAGGSFGNVTFNTCQVNVNLTWSFNIPKKANLDGGDTNQTSVGGAATTIIAQDKAMVFMVHDLTSGGVTLGLVDATGGVVTPAAFNGISGISFTRSAGVGLQATVTAGANPRLLSAFAISIGAP